MFIALGTKCGKEQNSLPFSPAVELNGTLFLSGQMGFVDGSLSGDTIASQTEATIDNIERLLRHEGLSLRHVFKVTAWLRRREDFAQFNETYRKLPLREQAERSFKGAMAQFAKVADRV